MSHKRQAEEQGFKLCNEWEYTPDIQSGITSLVQVLMGVEWSAGGYEETGDYYDTGERASGFCPCCEAPQCRGHFPRCKLAKLIGAKTVTNKQAERAVHKAQMAALAEERKQREAREAEWQAYLATLTPEQRAEEERKREDARERRRDHAASMERMVMFGCEPNPLSKLLGMTKAVTTNVRSIVIQDPDFEALRKRSTP